MDTIPIELEALERVFGDPSAEPIKVSYGLVRSVTDNFSSEIGRGGFGVVFMGYLGTEKIAVKKLSNEHVFSYKKFLDEIRCLIRAKHKNIVRFLGYCSDTQGEVAQFNGAYVVAEVQEKLLIFEYVPNGNIQHYLEEKPSGDDWHIRYKMINGICQGLRYLHEERIGHFDLKPENVLLDSDMEPKIADFGLSRFLDVGKSVIFTTKIYGTIGYIAPETMTRGELSFMSDMYALGIIVIKLLIGPADIDFDHWHESLGGDFPQMKTCIDIARACVEIEKSKRPTIGKIIDMLKDIGKIESSPHQASSGAFHLTDTIDASPLELVYPFIPNMRLSCSLALSNKTDGEVGYIFAPYSTGRFDHFNPMRGILPPMSSRAVPLVMLEQADLVPLEDSRLYIAMYIMKTNAEVREIIGNPGNSFEKLNKHVEARGGTAYLATATAVLCEHDPARVSMTTVQVCTSKEDHAVECIEVHPTEPWVLVRESRSGIFMWNWQTNEKIYEEKEAKSARFVLRMEWLVTGDSRGCVRVRMCPTMKEVVYICGAHGFDAVTLLAVHPTRPLLMSYCVSHSLKVWDWDQKWSCIWKFDNISSLKQLMFHPNSTDDFVTVEDDGTVQGRTLHVSWYKATDAFKGAPTVEHICNYRDDRHLIAAIVGGSDVQIMDLNQDELVHTIITANRICAIACHPTRPVLVTASDGGLIQVWDCTTYRLKKEYMDLMPTRISSIGLAGSTRLWIAFANNQMSIMDIDLE